MPVRIISMILAIRSKFSIAGCAETMAMNLTNLQARSAANQRDAVETKLSDVLGLNFAANRSFNILAEGYGTRLLRRLI